MLTQQRVKPDLFADQDKAVILEMHSACGNAVVRYVNCIATRDKHKLQHRLFVGLGDLL